MPFGLCNAPATFQRLMQRCLGGQLMDSTLVYLDDVIVYSPDFDSHLLHLEQVFRAMRRYGLKLQPGKCQLFKKEVQFLGHRVSAAGVAVDPEKVSAVQGWVPPKTIRQALHKRLLKNCKTLEPAAGRIWFFTEPELPMITWTPECETAFQRLKQELLQAPILAYADFTRPFVLYTDASNRGLGAVLAQRRDGTERVIAYASRSLHPAERNDANYSSFKIELLALKWALCEKFKDYLWGAEVLVVTDNSPLVHLQTAKLGAVEQRWVAQLANFNYRLQDRPGREHINADVLSRLPPVGKGGTPGLESEEGLMVGIVEAQGMRSDGVPASWGWDPHRWRGRQEQDEELAILRVCLEQNRLPGADERREHPVGLKKLLGHWKRLKLREGVICRSVLDSRTHEMVYQVVVPRAQIRPLLQAYHDQLGHQGQERTVSLLRRHFFWSGMEESVGTYVQGCPRCTLFKTRRDVRAPMVPVRPRAPLHMLAMDFLTLSRPMDRYQNILVVTDLFTKYAWAIPTLDQTATTTAGALWRHVFQPFGCPETLHSDQGPNFESRVIQELCQLYGCKKTHTTPYHPQGNGGCERFNQTLLSLLGTLDADHQGYWTDSLPALVQAYNNSVHSTTGYAPAYLMFGRHVRLPTDLLLGAAMAEAPATTTEWVHRHHRQLHSAYEKVSKHLDAAAQKNKRLYDRTAREAPLLPGERVLVRDNRRQGKGKLSDRWEIVPYLVEKRQRPDQPVYAIRPEGKTGPVRILHRNLLRPCPNYPRQETEAPPAPVAPVPPLMGWVVVPRTPTPEPREEEPVQPI
ncbi:retrotransposable element [Pimephales promelas]|nr:retrotransposable element [Pimephales promelas]